MWAPGSQARRASRQTHCLRSLASASHSHSHSSSHFMLILLLHHLIVTAASTYNYIIPMQQNDLYCAGTQPRSKAEQISLNTAPCIDVMTRQSESSNIISEIQNGWVPSIVSELGFSGSESEDDERDLENHENEQPIYERKRLIGRLGPNYTECATDCLSVSQNAVSAVARSTLQSNIEELESDDKELASNDTGESQSKGGAWTA